MSVTHRIIDWFERLGQLNIWSAFALGLFFTAAALVVFPRTPLILAAGATFGLSAVPIILLGSTAGGIIAFLVADSLPPLVSMGGFCDIRNWRRSPATAVDLKG